MLEFDCPRILQQGEVYISHQNDWHAQEIHPFSFFMVMWSAVIDKTKEESGEAKTAGERAQRQLKPASLLNFCPVNSLASTQNKIGKRKDHK